MKDRCLAFAEVIDALRVFPRLLLVGAFAFLCWYSVHALATVVGLVERMAETQDGDVVAMIVQNIAAGVVGITIPMIGNVFAKIADVYMNTGRRWVA